MKKQIILVYIFLCSVSCNTIFTNQENLGEEIFSSENSIINAKIDINSEYGCVSLSESFNVGHIIKFDLYNSEMENISSGQSESKILLVSADECIYVNIDGELIKYEFSSGNENILVRDIIFDDTYFLFMGNVFFYNKITSDYYTSNREVYAFNFNDLTEDLVVEGNVFAYSKSLNTVFYYVRNEMYEDFFSSINLDSQESSELSIPDDAKYNLNEQYIREIEGSMYCYYPKFLDHKIVKLNIGNNIIEETYTIPDNPFGYYYISDSGKYIIYSKFDENNYDVNQIITLCALNTNTLVEEELAFGTVTNGFRPITIQVNEESKIVYYSIGSNIYKSEFDI